MHGVQTIGRRGLLGAAATTAVAAVSANSVFPGAARAGPIDLADRANAMLIYRKLAWSLGQGFGFWWLQGTRYVLIDTELTALWDMHVGTIFGVRDLAGGVFEAATISVSIYTDIKSGEYIKAFTNPFTGKTIDIPYGAPKVSKVIYGPQGLIPEPNTPYVNRVTLGPPLQDGGKVWLREDHRFQNQPAANGQIFRVNDMSTYFAPVDVIADPAVVMAPAGQIFSDILTLPDWLGMPDHRGVLYSRAYGQKVARIEDMPQIWRTQTRRKYPDLYSNPKAALDG